MCSFYSAVQSTANQCKPPKALANILTATPTPLLFPLSQTVGYTSIQQGNMKGTSQRLHLWKPIPFDIKHSRCWCEQYLRHHQHCHDVADHKPSCSTSHSCGQADDNKCIEDASVGFLHAQEEHSLTNILALIPSVVHTQPVVAPSRPQCQFDRHESQEQ
jgi:hypothetical protein